MRCSKGMRSWRETIFLLYGLTIKFCSHGVVHFFHVHLRKMCDFIAFWRNTKEQRKKSCYYFDLLNLISQMNRSRYTSPLPALSHAFLCAGAFLLLCLIEGFLFTGLLFVITLCFSCIIQIFSIATGSAAEIFFFTTTLLSIH